VTSDALHLTYRHTWWALVLRGSIALALGIFILARPLDSVGAFALVIALWALMTGLTQIVHAVELRNVAAHWWVLLLSGLIGTGFGVAALVFYPTLSLAFAVLWTAWWLFLVGALALSVGFQERKLAMPWGWTVAWGVLGVIAGIYALFFPPATLVAIMGLIAAFAILGGLVLLFGAFHLGRAHQAALLASRSAPRP
jgi:uncharacterized membrane protein HdeD (DUF308 family)